jgi:hypothetical protein
VHSFSRRRISSRKSSCYAYSALLQRNVTTPDFALRAALAKNQVGAAPEAIRKQFCN